MLIASTFERLRAQRYTGLGSVGRVGGTRA